MLGISTPSLPLAFLADMGVTTSLAVLAGGGGIGLLAWLLWRERRDYALELADQMRLLGEEQEKTAREKQAKDEVARESQAKTEMLATLSREIRAHLNGVIGSADLMLDNTLRPHQREHLTTLRSSAESLHQSLNDVLDYATIETGRIKISQVPFDLRQPLIEVVEILSAPAQLKGLELVLIVAPDVPSVVVGDAQRLRQVVFKLMSNAVKFAPSGRIVLRVELPGRTMPVAREGGNWLQFSVSDSGEGIPEEMQAALFERSAGDDSSSPRKFGGSGLELAISKRLVELMGGQIGARRLPESGSEFWVVLPLEAEKTLPPPAFTLPMGLHVVVLDRDTASRVAASAMLTRLGVDQDATDLVADAAMLLRDAIDENARDLVLLLDEEIAKAEGVALASLFAADPALRAIRVVLMTRDLEDNAPADYDFPVTALMRKPLLRVENLVDALKTEPASGTVRVVDSRAPFAVPKETKDKDATPAARRGPYVLVVDDDAISRSVTSQLLERLGCVVEVAVNGMEAIGQARAAAFEIVFMDCQMPDMDGFMTTERILAAAGNKAPPIVAVTANTSEADREHCFAVGMCDFVSKPVTKAELARVLKRWSAPRGTAAVTGARAG